MPLNSSVLAAAIEARILAFTETFSEPGAQALVQAISETIAEEVVNHIVANGLVTLLPGTVCTDSVFVPTGTAPVTGTGTIT